MIGEFRSQIIYDQQVAVIKVIDEMLKIFSGPIIINQPRETVKEGSRAEIQYGVPCGQNLTGDTYRKK